MGLDEILRRYVPNFERRSILMEAHGGATRGHYAGKETTQKVLCDGFGGQLCIRMRNHIVGHVMHVKGLEGHRGGMKFPYNHSINE